MEESIEEVTEEDMKGSSVGDLLKLIRRSPTKYEIHIHGQIILSRALKSVNDVDAQEIIGLQEKLEEFMDYNVVIDDLQKYGMVRKFKKKDF